MKNTQKKLNAKHFRYLSKTDIDDPMVYLNDFFENEICIEYWPHQIGLVINAAANEEMNSEWIEAGFYVKRLIKQVELAYVIFKKCEIQYQEKPLNFLKCIRDYWNYVSGSGLTVDEVDLPADTISRFFSYQSLRDWYGTLDDLWETICNRNGDFLCNEGNEILAVRELLKRLAIALHRIYQNGVLPEREGGTRKVEEGVSPANATLSETEEPERAVAETPENNVLHPKQGIALPTEMRVSACYKEAVRDFFDKIQLDDWKRQVSYWRQAVMTEGVFWSASTDHNYDGSALLFNYACIYPLLALFFRECETRQDPCVAGDWSQGKFFCGTKSIHILHRGKLLHLTHITVEQLENPLGAIIQLLGQYTKADWDGILYDWLHYGLSKEAYVYGKYYDQTMRIYELLINVVELAYVLAFEEEIEIVDHVAQLDPHLWDSPNTSATC